MDRPEIFAKLDRVAQKKGDVFAALRELPIDVVADALLEVPSDYPAARAALPKMASNDVQDSWTGNHGHTLLFQSSAFVHSVETGFLKYAGRRLENANILDYGCGWGRLIRLMYKFSSPERLYGCDPWDKSIELCQAAGISANLAVCEYLPKEIPFQGVKFDLIYAFSVFTHLSESTARTVLSALRSAIADNGLLAITIRPDSYWYVHDVSKTSVDLDLMHKVHRSNGYAFTPHGHKVASAVDEAGLNTYGDASFTLEYIRQHWLGWDIVGTDVLLLDPYQTVVFLRPTVRT
ncbi:MAG: class I SAM-dependent methyltransferase [Paraburkholderia sp.]